jgi:hypothetical protein
MRTWSHLRAPMCDGRVSRLKRISQRLNKQPGVKTGIGWLRGSG